MVLAKHLPQSQRCTHLKGHGGHKGAVRQVAQGLGRNRFVLRTDVKSYYASIDHIALLDALAVTIKDRRVLNLIGQYLRRTSERGGIFYDFDRGISLGCPLSPLLAAFYLHELDRIMAARAKRDGLFYVRYMDDILVLAPTRWKLRRAVKAVNGVLEALGLEQHPDKTFIGLISRGFDFLGYHFSPDGLTLARRTIENFLQKVSRLYEQERLLPHNQVAALEVKITRYIERWRGWTLGGFGNGPNTLNNSVVADLGYRRRPGA